MIFSLNELWLIFLYFVTQLIFTMLKFETLFNIKN